MKQSVIYLDNAAATPMDTEVFAAMQPYYSEKFYNPSAQYLAAKSVKQDVELARANLAKTLGVKPSELIFTAGGTEANNLAINGILSRFDGANVLVSAVEHESVINPAKQFDCKFAPVNAEGIVDVSKLVDLVDNQTVLVSVMYANNEVGTIQPPAEIAKSLEVIRKKRQQTGNSLPLYFHTDACQAANTLDLHPARLGVDLMTVNGGKAYGPKQSGALFVRAGLRLNAQMLGGGQEFGLRSGTENVAQIIGLSAAVVKAQTDRVKLQEQLKELQHLFIDGLKQLPGVTINGSIKHRLTNNVHITVDGYDNERLMMELDEAGVQCATGSACNASNDEPSHVLAAMGKTEDQIRSSLRFSMGRQTTKTDVQKTLAILSQLLTKRV